jgi:hypothetical protein
MFSKTATATTPAQTATTANSVIDMALNAWASVSTGGQAQEAAKVKADAQNIHALVDAATTLFMSRGATPEQTTASVNSMLNAGLATYGGLVSGGAEVTAQHLQEAEPMANALVGIVVSNFVPGAESGTGTVAQ